MQQMFSSIPGTLGFNKHRSAIQRWAPIASLTSALILCPLQHLQAATIAFTFQTTAEASAFGVPSLSTPNLPTTVEGSGVFVPFGSAIYTEGGTVTFAPLPSGGFAPAFTTNTFTFSFDGGANTISGTNNTIFGAPNSVGFPTFVNTYTILGGTGIFNGATGSASANGISYRNPGPTGGSPVTPVAALGSGQIITSNLTAVPEPGSIALMGLAAASVLALRLRQRSGRRPTF